MDHSSRPSPGKRQLAPLDASQFLPGEFNRAEKVYKQMLGMDGRVAGKYKGFLRECMLDEEDIKERNLDHFKEPGVTEQMATLRYNHYQKKRIIKLGQIDIMIRNLNVQKSPSGFGGGSFKQEKALRKALDKQPKNPDRHDSSMSAFSDVQQRIDNKANMLKQKSHMQQSFRDAKPTPPNQRDTTNSMNQQAFLTIVPDVSAGPVTPRGEPQTTKAIIATKKFSMTHGGTSIDSDGGQWLQSEVQREKRKIERYILTTERRQDQLLARDNKLAKAITEKETKLNKEKKRLMKDREEMRLVRIGQIKEKMDKGAAKKQSDMSSNQSRAVSMYQSQMREYADRHEKKQASFKQASADAFNSGREKFKLDNLSGAKKRLAWEEDDQMATQALVDYESRGQRGIARSQASHHDRRARMGKLYDYAIERHDQHLVQSEQELLSKQTKVIMSLQKKQQQVERFEKKVKKEKQEEMINANNKKSNLSKQIADSQAKDCDKLAYNLQLKQDQVEKRLNNVEKARQQEINLVKERNRLNIEDLQKRSHFQRQYMRLDKLRIIDRQQRLENVYNRINDNKDAQKETARLANEVRLLKMQEGRSLSPHARIMSSPAIK